MNTLLKGLEGRFASRNRALFLLSEAIGGSPLSLRVKDVLTSEGMVKNQLALQHQVTLSEQLRQALSQWLSLLQLAPGYSPDWFLFHTQGKPLTPLSTVQCNRLLHQACEASGMSLPKHGYGFRYFKMLHYTNTTAQTQNLSALQTALGHKALDSTRRFVAKHPVARVSNVPL